MTYRDTITALAERTETSVLVVLALFRQGVLSHDETVARNPVLVENIQSTGYTKRLNNAQ